jgi:hypothetical protein
MVIRSRFMVGAIGVRRLIRVNRVRGRAQFHRHRDELLVIVLCGIDHDVIPNFQILP